MRTRTLTLVLSAAAGLGLMVATSVGAASMVPTRTNHLTFSGPVGLPGITLPRGTYTFEVIPLNPDIVRVLSRDGSQVYFTGFTRRVTRPMTLPADRLVTFREAPRGVAPRVAVWYPVGTTTGQQFIYPNATR